MSNFFKEKLDKAFETGKAAGRGFLSSRINAVFGGAKDIAKAGVVFGKDALGKGKEVYSPGILGVIANTAISVKDALISDQRGVLNPKKGSINPFNGEGWLNPFKYMRRLVAGMTEIGAQTIGGTIGVISGKTGEAVKNVIRGGSRAIGGVILGDYGHYLGDTAKEEKKEG